MLPATLRIGCRFEFDAAAPTAVVAIVEPHETERRSDRRRAVRPTCRHADHDLRRRLRQPLPAHDAAGGPLVVRRIERRCATTPGSTSSDLDAVRGRGRRSAGRDAGLPPPEPLLPVRRAGDGRLRALRVDGARLGQGRRHRGVGERAPHLRLRVVVADEDGRRRLQRSLRGVPGLRPPHRHDVPRPSASRRATSSATCPTSRCPIPGRRWTSARGPRCTCPTAGTRSTLATTASGASAER